MRKLFLIWCVALVMTRLVNAQTIDFTKTKSTQELHGVYIEKYKTYKTTGWVVLGAGIGMIAGGGIAFAGYAKQGFNGTPPATAETFFLIIGPSTALASIPFFILAKRNKTKAALVLKAAPSAFGNEIYYRPNYTALALTLDF